ncbi:hypothetical protein QBC39DRAFT_432852 [Podospora conica]|nr:hypothetical protein QBC39DRAFT_432852 [Schizothecium conicum]
MTTARSPLEIWRGLEAVQNLFAANLPWYESKLSRAGLSDASRSSILDFRTFLRFDIRQLSMTLGSSVDLASLSTNHAQDLSVRLAKVLHLLDARTDESVLVLLSALDGAVSKVTPSPNKGSTSILSSFWSFSRLSALLASSSSPPQSNQPPSALLTPDSNSPYPNLEALQTLLSRLDHDADPVFKYGHLINLGNTREEYHQVLHEIEQLNEFLMALGDTQETQASPVLKARTTPTDMLDLTFTREASSRLFTALVHSPVECGQAHRGLLHLTGFRRSDQGRTRPRWDMFLSCCLHPLGWLETRCNVSSPRRYAETATDAEKLDDLCGSVQWHRQHTSDALCLRLGGEQLFHVRGDGANLEYPDFDRPLSLDTLLERGYFRSAYDGGLFTPRSKRLLVANLARCLHSLHDSRWLQKEWNASDIMFLFDSEGGRILDMHRPYLPATLSVTIPRLREVRKGPGVPHHPGILSFAKLLVEIERGRKIGQDEYETSNGCQNDWLSISTILTRQLSGSLTGYYLSAVKACLDFSRPTGHGTQDQAEYIYKKIVTPLETELSHYIHADAEMESESAVVLPLPTSQDMAFNRYTLPDFLAKSVANVNNSVKVRNILSRAATSAGPRSDRGSPPQD